MHERNIVLVGFMGSGKSTVARVLTGCCGYRLVDLDAEIERVAGEPIAEIFRRRGETVFRDLESAALAGCVGAERIVLATGGGILGRPANRETMRRIGIVVYLRARAETLRHRLAGSTERPLINQARDWNEIERLLHSRMPLYEGADLIVDTDDRQPESIAQEILQHIREQQDAD